MVVSTEQVKHHKRKRIRAVEELYLNGYCAREIHDLIGNQFDVAYGTIRNDIVQIRKMWNSDMAHCDTLEGKDRYLASLRSMRRKVMNGWIEEGKDGRKRRVGRDFKLAHSIDRDIAKLSGVPLASDAHTLHLSIDAARGYMDKVMEIVMTRVADPEIQRQIVKDIEELGRG